MKLNLPSDSGIDDVISRLKGYVQGSGQPHVHTDHVYQAVLQFWESLRFDNLRDARLISFGMCTPIQPSGSCIMEDRQRFLAVLDMNSGVDQWISTPRSYRRCYQGLVRSYFTYDSQIETASTVGRQNWKQLRDYLSEHSHYINDKINNPGWVIEALKNQQLFSEEPCAQYAKELLSGDSTLVDHMCEQLGIIKASWFMRELILAQVLQATKLAHEEFTVLIPRLLELLGDYPVLRDRGLILVLDRYAKLPLPNPHQMLTDVAVEWWGNPWLPSNDTRWGGVSTDARKMVSEWLKREFIEAFFTKLAQDGVGDPRRANFWLRYVKSMDNIQFALGATVQNSRDKDFIVLRQRMKGLTTDLLATDSSNNAFVMTMGNLIAVEFGDMGNAFYGYDRSSGLLPFDMSEPVFTKMNVKNSLKHSSCSMWLNHKDGIHGWTRWEEMFEATIREHYGISSGAASTPTARATPAPRTPPKPAATPSLASTDTVLPYSRDALNRFASMRNLRVDDFASNGIGGNLWVRTNDDDFQVSKVLRSWNFKYKPDKGWWK
ncbi:MAG: EH signature domain-containing protein [Hydrogenophaga sp.]|nr:EH signature domain-containing protein [Hydrogenophaga sp.]